MFSSGMSSRLSFNLSRPPLHKETFALFFWGKPVPQYKAYLGLCQLHSWHTSGWTQECGSRLERRFGFGRHHWHWIHLLLDISVPPHYLSVVPPRSNHPLAFSHPLCSLTWSEGICQLMVHKDGGSLWYVAFSENQNEPNTVVMPIPAMLHTHTIGLLEASFQSYFSVHC